MLKKLLILNLDDLALYAGAECGLFLLVHLVSAAILFFAKEDTSFLFSGVVMPIAAAFAVLIAACAQVGVNFEMALRFGQTRRRALAQALGVTVIHGVFAMALAVLLVWLERLFVPALWVSLTGAKGALIDYVGNRSDWTGYLFIERVSLDWWWYPLLLAIGVAAGLILGALMQRFGQKGMWIIWAVVMVPTLGVQLLPMDSLPALGFLPFLLAALALAGLIWSVWSLLHATVRA